MKVISLLNPWAFLMASDAKRIETRSWSLSLRGPLAIHASKGLPRAAQDLLTREPFASVLAELGVRTRRELPRGQIVAVVDVVGCIRTDCMTNNTGRLVQQAWHGVEAAPHEADFGDYTAGRFAWVTRNVRRLKKPILAKGRLGLWEYDSAAIEAAL